MSVESELDRYVEQKVQEANVILDQIDPENCAKENHESPRITALIERIEKKLG